MKICGLQKVTLLDFPGHIACTVFLGGCNFNCPFCYNSQLIRSDGVELLSTDEFFKFLNKRIGILDGVAITGGEPLIHNDIKDFIMKIRNLGYKVKLDTNGSYPKVLKELINEGLVDYVAMDIKNTLNKYHITTDCNLNTDNIKESIELLINSNIEYEFRTTVVNELHHVDDFVEIGKMINGAKKYFIQCYQYQDTVRVKELSPMNKEQLICCLEKVQPYVQFSSLREIE